MGMLRALLAAALAAFAAMPASAETDAQWKPSAFNKVSKCRTLWIGLADVPDDSRAATRDTTFVCHTRYFLSHDNVTRTPDWVIERLNKKDMIKKFNRPKNKTFTTEKRVPPRGRATNADYTRPKAPLARGHMAPSDDFSKSKAWINESFIFSNAVPQIGAKFNGAIWNTLEDEVRSAAKARREIYVITGPVRGDLSTRTRRIPKSANACGNEIRLEGPKEAFICAADNTKPNVFCKKGVGVPIGLFKIVYDPKRAEAFAFLMPNIEYETGIALDAAREKLEQYRVAVSAIEEATAIRFFHALPADKQDRIVRKCATGTLW